MQDNPEVFRFQSLDSTNSKLHEFMAHKDLAEFSAVIASHQTAGRGQIGNSWESEKDQNLTFSIVLYPHFLKIQKQFRITQMITTAITDVLIDIIPDISIKWPNDIYAGNKKIAGILIENSLSGATISSTIVGVGLNVNQEVFISDAPNPVSMRMLTQTTFDLDALFMQIRQAMIFRYIQWLEHGIRSIKKDYFKRLYRNEGFFEYRDENGSFMAKIDNIQDSGHLLLTDASGKPRIYAFKEVSFVH
jgi:BirA family biotin operon repressor/biotin-[acetyl-CoA-carboxylase] ligase